MLGALGGIMVLVGWIWLIVTAIQVGADTKEKVIWGLVNFFCQPIGGIVFYIMKKAGLVPLLILIVGYVLMFLGGGFNYSYNMGT